MNPVLQLDAVADSKTAQIRARQPKLFHLENPLTVRFGNSFFRSLPEGPGVYFFHGSQEHLLCWKLGPSATPAACTTDQPFKFAH